MRALAIPSFLAVVVVSLATLLLAIGARSPYTHANLLPGYNPSYSRTEQSLVGSPQPFRGAVPSEYSPDPVQRGSVLFVARECASCHAIDGRGGVIGPPIVGADVQMLKDKVYKGPDGMPAYSREDLTDDELGYIAAYLKAVKERGTNP